MAWSYPDTSKAFTMKRVDLAYLYVYPFIFSPLTSWSWKIQVVQRLLQCLHSVEYSQSERLRRALQGSQLEREPTC